MNFLRIIRRVHSEFFFVIAGARVDTGDEVSGRDSAGEINLVGSQADDLD